MRAVPVRGSVTFKYIIRANDIPDLTPNKDFLDDYVNNTTLVGESFTIDAAEVHTFIVNLIAQNKEAESVIKVHENESSGRYAGRVRFGRGRGGRGYGGGSYSRTGSKVITLKNGRKIDYHASIKFDNDVYNNITENQRNALHRKRKEYQENQGNSNYGGNKRSIEKVQREIDNLKSSMRSVPGDVPSGTRSHISQLTGGGPIMGGRNEQEQRKGLPAGRYVTSVTTIRRIGSISANHQQPEPVVLAANKCNTNADTCCLGRNFVVLEYTTRMADAYAHDKEIAPLNDIPIVSGATSWDDPASVKTYSIVINEALYYGIKLDHSLINPNQIRAYGVTFWGNPYDKERGLPIEVDDTVNIHMNTMGTKKQFESIYPTNKVFRECPKLILTEKNGCNLSSVLM